MSEAVESFLVGFFGEGNDLAPDELAASNPALAEWLEERIADLRRDPLTPSLLPRRQGNTVTWYGLAQTLRDRRELIELLQAFVGPTYGALRIDRPLDSTDPLDAAALAFAAHAFTVDVLPGEQAEVRHALEVFFGLQEARPQRQLSLARPLGRLLREFEMAVVAGSNEVSSQVLEEIESTGQLSAQNIVFLRIRRLAGLRQFRDVTELPELATILSIRRPSRVTAALFDAVYATELARFEAGDDPAGALLHFRDHVITRFPALFRSRQGLQTASAVKTFALYAASAHTQDHHLAQLATSNDLVDPERSYVETIAGLVAPRDEPSATLPGAVEAARLGSFDAALELARHLEPTVERAELLVRCAIEIDSLDAMTVALAAVNELDESDRIRITSSRLYAAPWERIERAVGGEGADAAPTTWLSWFEQAMSRPAFDNALEVAERSVVEWTSDALTPADSRAISQILNQDLAPGPLRRIKDALPHLLQFIDRVSEPAQHRQLLEDLSTLLLLDDDPSVSDVAVLVTVVGSLFALGATAERRRQLVDDFTDLYARVDSAAYLDAAIDLLDIVLTFAAGDDAPRATALSTVAAALQRWRRRVRPDQWLFVRDLAAETGAGEMVSHLIPELESASEDEVRCF